MEIRNKNKKYLSELELYQWYISTDDTVPSFQRNARRKNQVLISEFIEKHAGPLNGKRGLEVGCGRNGLFAFFQRNGSLLVESDLILDAMHDIRTKGSDYAVVASVESLPFKSESFDFVFCAGLIHHLGTFDVALSEMARTLKQGDSIFIIEPNRDYFLSLIIEFMPHRIQLFLRRRVLPKTLKGYVRATESEHPIEARKIEEALRKLGIDRIEEFFNTSPPPYLPKTLAVIHVLIERPLTKLFPNLSRRFAWQYITFGKRMY